MGRFLVYNLLILFISFFICIILHLFNIEEKNTIGYYIVILFIIFIPTWIVMIVIISGVFYFFPYEVIKYWSFSILNLILYLLPIEVVGSTLNFTFLSPFIAGCTLSLWRVYSKRFKSMD